MIACQCALARLVTHLADAFIQSELHSSYSFYILSGLAFPGNRTHDLGVASAMLYQLSYRKAASARSRLASLARFLFVGQSDVHLHSLLQGTRVTYVTETFLLIFWMFSTSHVNYTAFVQLCEPSEDLIGVKSVCSSGVFSETVAVMEGDSVTLNTGVTEIREDDDVLWKYGAENSQIAKMKKKKHILSTFNGPDGRFRDRLKLDNQTGSLTITNITTEHAGVYRLEIIGAKKSSKTFSVSVHGE